MCSVGSCAVSFETSKGFSALCLSFFEVGLHECYVYVLPLALHVLYCPLYFAWQNLLHT